MKKHKVVCQKCDHVFPLPSRIGFKCPECQSLDGWDGVVDARNEGSFMGVSCSLADVECLDIKVGHVVLSKRFWDYFSEQEDGFAYDKNGNPQAFKVPVTFDKMRRSYAI